jgi:hypothetical protein
MSTTQFSELSIQLTSQISKQKKRENGIYFTPKNISTDFTSKVLEHFPSTESLHILEPSCGSCEFIQTLGSLSSNHTICGIEFDSTIFNQISSLTFPNNSVSLINQNFIQYDSSIQPDLIIGNPPFVVIKKSDVPVKYLEFIVGRPNIFGLFILHSLSLLSPGGILAFIVPKSFLNSLYYSKIRNFIKQTCEIIDIIDYEHLNSFLDTEQATFGLILKKCIIQPPPPIEFCSPCQFSIKHSNNFIFTSDSVTLNKLFEGSTTIKELDLIVKTGSIVWNEHKEKLTSNEKNTVLIYNTNITAKNEIKLTQFKNEEKHQYIELDGYTDSVIVVNRGNGNSTYKLKYALVSNMKTPYLVENHLNVIQFANNTLSPKDIIKLQKKILESFKDPRTDQFIKLFLGNNALSKTELETIFPIYI